MTKRVKKKPMFEVCDSNYTYFAEIYADFAHLDSTVNRLNKRYIYLKKKT